MGQRRHRRLAGLAGGVAATLCALSVVVGVLAFPAGAGAGAVSAAEARAELGRRLFFDPAVSRSGNNSCASCHDGERAWSDARRVDDDDFLPTRRHSQTLVDVGDRHAFHWDGEFDSIEELVTRRLGVPSGIETGYGAPPANVQPKPTVTITDEHGVEHTVDLRTLTPVAELVEKDGRYGDGFEKAFGSRRVTTARMAEAIASFVRSIRHLPSAYDRYAAGDRAALSDEARRGMELFRIRAGCVQCHSMAGPSAPFTDDRFHNTGVSQRTSIRTIPQPGTGKDRPPGLETDLGHGQFVGGATEERTFKTPTLRDVAARGPYMHDGSFSNLDEVVRHYAKGATPNPGLDPLVRPFKASDQDVADLVAFLGSLSSSSRPGLAPEFAGRARRTRLKFVDAAGRPVQGLAVTLVPDGDRLPGDAALTSPVRVLSTDAEGRLEFEPPRRTHSRLQLPDGLRLEQGEWIPDTCESAELTLPIRGRCTVLVHFPAGSEPPKRLAASYAFDKTVRSEGLPEFLPPWAQSVSRAVFVLEGVAPVSGRPLARYVAWVRIDAPKEAALDVPAGPTRREHVVSLDAGRETKIDLGD